MCFRPATVALSLTCPNCGKKVNEVLGSIPDECPFCETDISELAAEVMANSDQVTAAPKSAFVQAPGAPAAPSAPAAPGAPKAPNAPKE